MKQAILLLCCQLLLNLLSYAQPVISFQSIATGFTQPLDIVPVNDGTNRLFIVERAGNIRIVKGSTFQTTPFLNVSSLITTANTEQGLLSLAFHPDYTTNGYFYIWYTNTSGAVTLARYTRSTDTTANAASGVVLLTIAKSFPNHNGAKLRFGTDGYLYFGTGDGGSGGDPDNNAQNGASLLGKILRIDVNNPVSPYYSIPPGNPYAGSTTIKNEIIAVGVRNPWRWSFDKQTGDMWIADVGQDAWEEVNVVKQNNLLGLNYGWSCLEGTHSYKTSCGTPANTNYVAPIFEYGHNNTTGGFSITGGYVYRGTEYPSLQGYYITSDYVSNHGWLIKPNGNGGYTTTMQSSWATNISTYGEASDGTLYAASLSNGTLYKVVASDPLPIHLVSFTGVQNGNYHQLNWSVDNEQKGDVYIVEKRETVTEPFIEVYRTSAVSDRNSNSYSIKLPASAVTYYRLKSISKNGDEHYSAIVTLQSKISNAFTSTINNHSLYVKLPQTAKTIILQNSAGQLLYKENVATGVSLSTIDLSAMPRGIIIVTIKTNDRLITGKVVY